MSTATLSTIAIDVVGQYHLAGQHLARAYQTGVQRAAGALSERFATALQSRELPLVNDAVKASLIEAQQHVAGVVAESLRASSAAIATMNDRIAEGVKSGIERMAGTAARVDAALERDDGRTLNVLALPSAQLSLSVASAVADGAKRLGESMLAAEENVIDVPAAPKAAKVAKRTTRRA
jgi:hypothetical protein